MRALAFAALLAAASLIGCARTPSMADAQAPVERVQANASPTSNEAAPPTTTSPTGIPGRTRPAPPMSKPLPPEVLPAPASATRLDTSCRSDADCVVKNVGSCCGAKPACVNRNAKVDAAAVQADCAARGIASVCGFEDIQSCSCNAGTCLGNNATTPVAQ